MALTPTAPSRTGSVQTPPDLESSEEAGAAEEASQVVGLTSHLEEEQEDLPLMPAAQEVHRNVEQDELQQVIREVGRVWAWVESGRGSLIADGVLVDLTRVLLTCETNFTGYITVESFRLAFPLTMLFCRFHAAGNPTLREEFFEKFEGGKAL